MTQNFDDISTRAMLVRFSVSTWTARKFDKVVTKDAQTAKNAGAKSGRFNKDLLAGAEVRDAVIAAATAARNTHYKHTLPWTDEGVRLIPIDNIQAYTDAMRTARTNFDRAVESLISSYDVVRDNARAELGKMYDEREYPSTSEVREKFDWSIDFDPVPTVGDIRVELPADMLQTIESRMQVRQHEATREAMSEAWRRLEEAVTRISKATEPKGRIFDTLIEHAKDTATLLGKLNVAQDTDLEATRARVLSELATIDVEALREDDALRADTKAKADAILDSMSGFFEPMQRTEAA